MIKESILSGVLYTSLEKKEKIKTIKKGRSYYLNGYIFENKFLLNAVIIA